ncbi:hypothetical protein RHSIM_Rhsim12G0127800 [Rhododendron simsii]|uniref:Uncharacterized protein n=1 Tax=Rhododendron simsii TaxID=118357 RepID=A0A834G4M8_RHOSS|nr:hypothetical protein RHSIM_Rhsim12G0127800 [Rhododendron simsii]
MEVLKLSRFKLQLQALVTEVRQLREREHFATEQLTLSNQKQKHTEEEFERKQSELQAELALSNELRQKLGRKVSYLENDNAMLENKQKELKGTIASLLQARESFVKVYEFGGLKVEDFWSESTIWYLKFLEAHCFSIQQSTDSTCEMRRSIQARDRKLAILSEKIDAHLSQFDTIQKEAFSVKQVLDYVQHLALQLELRSLGVILQKIQKAVTQLNDEDRRTLSSVVGGQEDYTSVEEKENNRIEDVDQNIGENYPSHDCEGGTAKNAASMGQEHDSVCNPMQGNNNLDSCISEDNCTTLLHHQDSESSTTPSRNP